MFCGQVVLVDNEDYEELSKYRWHVNGKYASRSVFPNRRIYMHRLILGAKAGEEVDHIDQNKFNNTRENLRICSRSENMQNRTLRTNKSGFVGVYFDRKRGLWRSKITAAGKFKHLGHFELPQEAARAYDCAAKEIYGKHARLNFD